MNHMSSSPSNGSAAAARTALAPTPETRATLSPHRTLQKPGAPAAKPVGYGLPCAKCRKYYAANLGACPVCKSTQRVAPAAPLPCPVVEGQSEGTTLDEERARMLRELKSKLYTNHGSIPAPTHSPQACSCAKDAHATHDAPTVCKSCYARLQARIDVLEAALHIDLKEAAQIIYDAVWADTSDSSKTYQNAAQALVGELRKRAGIKLILGPVQPLAH